LAQGNAVFALAAFYFSGAPTLLTFLLPGNLALCAAQGFQKEQPGSRNVREVKQEWRKMKQSQEIQSKEQEHLSRWEETLKNIPRVCFPFSAFSCNLSVPIFFFLRYWGLNSGSTP
jgi:hypothetical protein